MPLEGQAAPSPWWWCLLVVCVVVDGLVTSRDHRMYKLVQKKPLDKVISITSCPTLACTIPSTVSLLINLETAQQGRSMLLSDEQKLLIKGWKKGFA
jgi:hypothetical protein